MGIIEIAALVLLLLGVLFAVLAWRRLRTVRRGGIDVAVRYRAEVGARGWHLGVGRYWGDKFAWYRVASLRSGPDRVLHRARLRVVQQREPSMPETYAVPPGSVVLRCRAGGVRDGDPAAGADELELAMGRDSLTGFLSWLESSPPGRRARR